MPKLDYGCMHINHLFFSLFCHKGAAGEGLKELRLMQYLRREAFQNLSIANNLKSLFLQVFSNT